MDIDDAFEFVTDVLLSIFDGGGDEKVEYRKQDARIDSSIVPERIVRNAIKCNKCGDEIESTHRHDFKHCKCLAVAVDGGLDYRRRLGNREDYTELSEVFTKSNGRDT